MTPAELIAEGRALDRECVLLRRARNGPAAAVWHTQEPQDADFDRVLTVDTRHIPALRHADAGFLTVYADQRDYIGGRIEFTRRLPADDRDIPLYAHRAQILPPIDAVFLRGSAAVENWLRSHQWKREYGYNSNFGGSAVVREYARVREQECPYNFESDILAVLGGWAEPWPDGEWDSLIDETLLLQTTGQEPCVEAWWLRNGDFKVAQRIT